MLPVSGVAMLSPSGPLIEMVEKDGVVQEDLNFRLFNELKCYCGGIDLGDRDFETWPASVIQRWKMLNAHKSPNELAILSWNTNGRLDLRGCRESLLRRWSGKGFVDVGLIQEHFKKAGNFPFQFVWSRLVECFKWSCWGVQGTKKWWMRHFWSTRPCN